MTSSLESQRYDAPPLPSSSHDGDMDGPLDRSSSASSLPSIASLDIAPARSASSQPASSKRATSVSFNGVDQRESRSKKNSSRPSGVSNRASRPGHSFSLSSVAHSLTHGGNGEHHFRMSGSFSGWRHAVNALRGSKSSHSSPVRDQRSGSVVSGNGLERRPSQDSRMGPHESLHVKRGLSKYQNDGKTKRTKDPLIVRACLGLVDSKCFIFITTVLTLFALIGDDLKLLLTNQPADQYFDVIMLTCLSIFTMEIICASIGKRDYFLGFFFLLDCISTASILLDLSYVSEYVMGDDGEDLDKLRSGRTARLGARAGRVVRVIRLVRILKLYKSCTEAYNIYMRERRRRKFMLLDKLDKIPDGMGRKSARAKCKAYNMNDDDWDDAEGRADLDEDKFKTRGESRVGRKLSDVTTMRVICLVLTMMLVLPFLQTDAGALPPVAAFYGADEILQNFMEWNTTKSSDYRLVYENSLLKYLYYFNWFSGNIPSAYAPDGDKGVGPPSFQSHVFWVGIVFRDTNVASDGTDMIENAAMWDAALAIRRNTTVAYAAKTEQASRDIYPTGSMPTIAHDTISGRWTTECSQPEKGIRRKGFSLIGQSIPGQIDYVVKCPEDMRRHESAKYFPRTIDDDQHAKWHFAFYFDKRPLHRQEVSYSLCITSFICLVLLGTSVVFSKDMNRLVLRPVEKMTARVDFIRVDPMSAVKMADEEFKMEEKKKAREAMKSKKSRIFSRVNKTCMCTSTQEHQEPMETVILEKTIIKLGSLLALGFGEAGANIIANNLESIDSAGVNGMVPGCRVEAIIGIARIRDFSTATEVLKSKVMTFVNQIAEIVHGVVSEFHGAANKNNGDTFLVVWRIHGLEDAMISRMADFSAIAFAKILGSVHRSPVLATYRAHPALQQRLGSKYRVSVTFGLHAGWAIEGAVGSEFKIDASYLSANVSIALTIEQATSIYGVPILLTDSVADLCCKTISGKFRKIDRVIISGSSEPIDLYTLDLDYLSLPVCQEPRIMNTWNQRLRFKARQFLEVEKSMKLQLTYDSHEMFDEIEEIQLMHRKRYTSEFTHLFNMGYANYFEGEWQVARRCLEKTQKMLFVEDGPSTALLRFMESPYNFAAPPDWTGVHDLHKILV